MKELKKEVSVSELGWNSDAIAYLTEGGTYEFTTHEGGTTYWEYDPDAEMSRHCGDGAGCFWTD